jgi:hypothetical protein
MSTDPIGPADVASQPEDPDPEQHAGDDAPDTPDGTAVDAYTANLEPDQPPTVEA